MKRVIVESPYAGDTTANLLYLEDCLMDCHKRNEAPFASHYFYTGYLSDIEPEQRKMGMECGFAWMQVCDLVAVYIDNGISDGMKDGIQRAEEAGKEIEFRRLKDGDK